MVEGSGGKWYNDKRMCYQYGVDQLGFRMDMARLANFMQRAYLCNVLRKAISHL